MPSDNKPAAAQEAVAWFTDDHLTDRSATTYDAAVAERWRAKGWPVTPLYAAPVAAAPVDGRDVRSAIAGLEGSVAVGSDGEWVSVRRTARDAAVAALRNVSSDCAHIFASYSEAKKRTPAAPGIDLPAQHLPVHISCIADIEKVGMRCLDSGACHHQCKDKCFRKDGCVPLSIAGSYLNDNWTLKQADASPKGGSKALARAYGYLWHVNHPEDIPAGHPYMSADRAAVEARKELRDMLTHEQRGEGINWVRQNLLAAMQATSADDGGSVVRGVTVERLEDMSVRGRLKLYAEEDGDMCMMVIENDGTSAGIEFCASGGRSPRTLEAVRALSRAMEQDNAEHPISRATSAEVGM